MSNFLVYKSSAGSGKTYTLMLIYLSLVLKEPNRFRKILAITFTNKAANEIKERITSSLAMIADTSAEQIPDKRKHLFETLELRTGLSFDKLKENAARALTLILHNYSDFAVSTIDSFVHRVIRAFAFDLKLSMSFEVEMDNKMLLARAVEDLISAAGTDERFTDLLVNFIVQKAEEDESWQIDRLLISFAENLFRENTPDGLSIAQTPEPGQIKDISHRIKQFSTQYKTSLKKIGTEANELLSKNNIDPELIYRGKTGIAGFFANLDNGRTDVNLQSSYIRKSVDENEWLSSAGKKSPLSSIILNIAPDLKRLFHQAEDIITTQKDRVTVLEMIRMQLYPMSVLTEISKRLETIKKEENLLPIAEFNRIVSNIVAEEPVPFIYERLGEKFRHYMIDEFQDTSVLQWQNLMPLIENSLAQGGLNMIVGDGKQAIYRFRNGDVQQFVNLPKVNNPRNSQVLEQRARALERNFTEENLASNFRSKQEVVYFNNNFFDHISKKFLGSDDKVYAHGNQQPKPGNTGGLVQIEFLENQKNVQPDAHTARVGDLITELHNQGFRYGDIAVLCRTNSESSKIALHLFDLGIEVVSSDSLLLRNSAEVVFLVSWFSFLSNPEDEISRIYIANYLYDHYQPTGSKAAFLKKSKNYKDFQQLLSGVHPEATTENLRGLSVFDQTEMLIRLFGLQDKAPLYLQFFLDEVLRFSTTTNTSPDGFLEYWNTHSGKLSAVLPANENAVQVMTIHKSKGLEFPVVIYPFAYQKVSPRSEKVWAEVNDEIIPEIKLAYLDISKKLENTKYHSIAEEVNSKKRLDLLNMVYVAFTRPSERLYVLSSLPSEKSENINSVAGMLTEFLKFMQTFNPEETVYRFGNEAEVNSIDKKEEITTSNSLDFISNPWHNRLIFATRAPANWEAGSPEAAQESGNILHSLLAGIKTKQDIENSVIQIINEGLITKSEEQEFIFKLQNIIEDEKLSRFFNEDCIILNEAEIIAPDGKSFRPDRVVLHSGKTDVLDFKTGKPVEKHTEQVRSYARLLQMMGHREIRAWLVYLGDKPELKEVELEQ